VVEIERGHVEVLGFHGQRARRGFRRALRGIAAQRIESARDLRYRFEEGLGALQQPLQIRGCREAHLVKDRLRNGGHHLRLDHESGIAAAGSAAQHPDIRIGQILAGGRRRQRHRLQIGTRRHGGEIGDRGGGGLAGQHLDFHGSGSGSPGDILAFHQVTARQQAGHILPGVSPACAGVTRQAPLGAICHRRSRLQ